MRKFAFPVSFWFSFAVTEAILFPMAAVVKQITCVQFMENQKMPKYAVAFITPDEKHPLRQRIIEAADKETALKQFFTQDLTGFYSNDSQGFHYFKEDFLDKAAGQGSILTFE
jgi:ABC-type sugar transport system substrate-binding protein